MAADLPPYLSVSQITTYLQCPRKYRFRYLDRLTPERRSVELAFGIAVHASVAWWVTERVEGRDPSPDELRRISRIYWHAELAPGEIEFRKQTAAELGGIAQSVSQLFAERFRAETLLGAEVGFEVELWDPIGRRTLPVPLIGYLDIVTPEGFVELKTCSKKSSWRNWALQLAAYAHAERERTGRAPAVRVVELLRAATPTLVEEVAPVSERDRAWFLEVAAEVFARTSRGAFHPVPSFICTRCEYAHACSAARSRQRSGSFRIHLPTNILYVKRRSRDHSGRYSTDSTTPP